MSDNSAREPLQSLSHIPGLEGIDPALLAQTVAALQAQQTAQPSQQQVSDAPQMSAPQPKDTWSEEEEAAGQALLQGLRFIADKEASTATRVASINNKHANARFWFKMRMKDYQHECKLQDRHNDRIHATFMQASKDAERTGAAPPAMYELDERQLQPPEIPACMTDDHSEDIDRVPDTVVSR